MSSSKSKMMTMADDNFKKTTNQPDIISSNDNNGHNASNNKDRNINNNNNNFYYSKTINHNNNYTRIGTNTMKSQHRRKKTSKEKLHQQKSVLQKLRGSDHHMAMVLSYCGVFLLYGMTDELLGPTLIELSCLARETLKKTSWLFFSHDLGLLFGTLFGGLIVSRVDRNLAITICLGCNALCISILPSLHRLFNMVVVAFLYGIFLGTPDTLSNVMLVKVFGKSVAPYLQGVYFFYGFGAFLSPLTARPFLRKSCTYVVNTTRYFDVPTMNSTYDNKTGYWMTMKSVKKLDEDSDVMYAYWIIALLHVPVMFGLSWMFFNSHLESKKGIYRGSFVFLHNDRDEDVIQTLDVIPYHPEASLWERIQKDTHQRLVAVTILCSAIMFLYEGLMAMFGGYIYSYSVKGTVSMTSDQGAYLTSMYWGFFALGRFAGIIFSFFMPPKSMLMANVVGCFVSSIVFVGGQTNLKAIYVGTCLLGLFLSSTAPTIIAMAEQYVDLTAHTTSILIISSALGELTMPVLVGQVFERIGTRIVPIVVFLLCFLGFLGYCLLLTFDNDKAYEHASILWKITCNFLHFGRDSRKSGSPHCMYSSADTSSSNYPSSSDVSIELDNSKIAEIPKPDMYTGRVQPPPDIEVIDEALIIADFEYGEFKGGSLKNVDSTNEAESQRD